MSDKKEVHGIGFKAQGLKSIGGRRNSLALARALNLTLYLKDEIKSKIKSKTVEI